MPWLNGEPWRLKYWSQKRGSCRTKSGGEYSLEKMTDLLVQSVGRPFISGLLFPWPNRTLARRTITPSRAVAIKNLKMRFGLMFMLLYHLQTQSPSVVIKQGLMAGQNSSKCLGSERSRGEHDAGIYRCGRESTTKIGRPGQFSCAPVVTQMFSASMALTWPPGPGRTGDHAGSPLRSSIVRLRLRPAMPTTRHISRRAREGLNGHPIPRSGHTPSKGCYR